MNKKFKFGLLSLLIVGVIGVSLQSCKKEETTYYKAYLYNDIDNFISPHHIKVDFYKDGAVAHTIELNPNDSFKIADGSLPGKSPDKRFKSDYFGGVNDSIVVTFDNQFKLTHYMKPPSDSLLAPIFYFFDDNNNLWNPRSYLVKKVKEDGHTVRIYQYYFTENDYHTAKGG